MRKHLWSVSAFALLAAFASEAQAQTATPPVADDGDAAAAVPAGALDRRQATPSYPGEIVVYASMRAANLSVVLMSITAISARKSVGVGMGLVVRCAPRGRRDIQKQKNVQID